MQTITELWQYLQTVPIVTWEHILDVVAASGLFSLILQILKLRLHIDSKHLLLGMLAVMSFLGSAAAYVLSTTTAPPLPAIANYWAYIMAAATILHRFAVSPMFKALQAWLERKVATPTPVPVMPAEQAPATPQGFAE
jgi:hypothetical protein